MRYEVWSEAEPEVAIRTVDLMDTDNPPVGCWSNLDALAECALCARPIRIRDGYPSLDLHVACRSDVSGYEDGGEAFPAMICADCARAEGQEVPEPATADERIEALERNLGRLVGAMRELTDVVRRMLGAYVVDENGTVSE